MNSVFFFQKSNLAIWALTRYDLFHAELLIDAMQSRNIGVFQEELLQLGNRLPPIEQKSLYDGQTIVR